MVFYDNNDKALTMEIPLEGELAFNFSLMYNDLVNCDDILQVGLEEAVKLCIKRFIDNWQEDSEAFCNKLADGNIADIL